MLSGIYKKLSWLIWDFLINLSCSESSSKVSKILQPKIKLCFSHLEFHKSNLQNIQFKWKQNIKNVAILIKFSVVKLCNNYTKFTPPSECLCHIRSPTSFPSLTQGFISMQLQVLISCLFKASWTARTRESAFFLELFSADFLRIF